MQNGSRPRSRLERFCRRGSVRKLRLLWALGLSQILGLSLVVQLCRSFQVATPEAEEQHTGHSTCSSFAAGLHPHPEHLRVLLAVTRGADDKHLQVVTFRRPVTPAQATTHPAAHHRCWYRGVLRHKRRVPVDLHLHMDEATRWSRFAGNFQQAFPVLCLLEISAGLHRSFAATGRQGSDSREPGKP